MDIKENLQEIYREVFDDEELVIFEEMTSEDIEEWDSLTHIELIVAIEEKFNIRFTTEEIKSLENVGDFIKTIAEKIS